MTSFLKRLPGLLGALLVSCAAQAQPFPSKPVVLMVPGPRPLDELSKLYADNTAQMRAIAKSMNLQPQ